MPRCAEDNSPKPLQHQQNMYFCCSCSCCSQDPGSWGVGQVLVFLCPQFKVKQHESQALDGMQGSRSQFKDFRSGSLTRGLKQRSRQFLLVCGYQNNLSSCRRVACVKCFPFMFISTIYGYYILLEKGKNAGIEKPLPTIIKEKEPLWYHETPSPKKGKRRRSMRIKRAADLA